MRKGWCSLISGVRAAVRAEPWSRCWKQRPRGILRCAADYPDIAWAFKVVSVPTLVLFRGGVPVDDIVGAVPAQRIEELLVESGREGRGA